MGYLDVYSYDESGELAESGHESFISVESFGEGFKVIIKKIAEALVSICKGVFWLIITLAKSIFNTIRFLDKSLSKLKDCPNWLVVSGLILIIQAVRVVNAKYAMESKPPSGFIYINPSDETSDIFTSLRDRVKNDNLTSQELISLLNEVANTEVSKWLKLVKETLKEYKGSDIVNTINGEMISTSIVPNMLETAFNQVFVTDNSSSKYEIKKFYENLYGPIKAIDEYIRSDLSPEEINRAIEAIPDHQFLTVSAAFNVYLKRNSSGELIYDVGISYRSIEKLTVSKILNDIHHRRLNDYSTQLKEIRGNFSKFNDIRKRIETDMKLSIENLTRKGDKYMKELKQATTLYRSAVKVTGSLTKYIGTSYTWLYRIVKFASKLNPAISNKSATYVKDLNKVTENAYDFVKRAMSANLNDSSVKGWDGSATQLNINYD